MVRIFGIRGITSAGHAAIPHTSAMIKDGEIVNADVSDEAAIAGSKLNPVLPNTIANLLSDHDLARHPLEIIPEITLAKLAAEAKYWNDLNKVKLPSPSVSDYITPSAASASSPPETLLLDSCESGWTYTEKDNNEIIEGTQPATDWYVEGSGSLKITGNLNTSDVNNYGQFEKSIDLTDINMIHVRVKGGSGGSSNVADRILVGGVQKYEHLCDTAFEETVDIDVSALTGSTPIAFKQICYTTGNYKHPDFWADNLRSDPFYTPLKTIDEDTSTQWRPDPVNEAGAWCRWDMGAPKICSGCRIYWGADAAYRPTAYRIQVSEDGETDWATVVTETEAAPASAWKEYSWAARYARYIRCIVDTHGATGTEIFEADYYSRIVERVAAEHGHGSGVTPHLKGHGVRAFESARSKGESVPDLRRRIEILENMVG